MRSPALSSTSASCLGYHAHYGSVIRCRPARVSRRSTKTSNTPWCFVSPFSSLTPSPHVAKLVSKQEKVPLALSSSTTSQRGIKLMNDRTMIKGSKKRTRESSSSVLFGTSPQFVSSTIVKDESFVLSAVVLLANIGLVMERRTKIGKVLSANIVTMALALLFSNVGIIPFSSPIYNMVNKKLVPLAVALLLFDSDLRRVLRDTGSLMICFLVGAISTIVGTLVAFPLVPMTSLGSNEGYKVASALMARHKGGAVNFISVAETLQVSSSSVSAAIAADNVVVALYFAWLFYSSKDGLDDEEDSDIETNKRKNVNLEQQEQQPREEEERIEVIGEEVSSQQNDITLMTISSSLAISTCLLWMGSLMTKLFLPSGTSSLPMISFCSVIAATIFPKKLQRLSSTSTAMGVIMIQMFFAVSGAAGSIRSVFQKAPSLLLFSSLQVGIHYITLMFVGRLLLKLNKKELYVASNANVGGPTTAAAMAQAKKWKRLIMPGLLVGIFGYATATPLSLAFAKLLLSITTMNAPIIR